MDVNWFTTGPDFWTDLVSFDTPLWVLLVLAWVLFR